MNENDLKNLYQLLKQLDDFIGDKKNKDNYDDVIFNLSVILRSYVWEALKDV